LLLTAVLIVELTIVQGKAEESEQRSSALEGELNELRRKNESLKESNVDLERQLQALKSSANSSSPAHSSKDVEVEYPVCIVSLS